MQKLLTIAESGWDSDTIHSESAFGAGFMSVVYSCEEATVESKGKSVTIRNEEAIAGQAFAVTTGSFIGGTRITLKKYALDETKTKLALSRYAMSFPIHVYFNGEELARPHALENLISVKTDVGQISASGLHKQGVTDAGKAMLYLQGLPIQCSDILWRSSANVIHLDQTFAARMPDRDSLIDAEHAKKRICEALRTVWREHLTAVKAKQTPEEFIANYPAMVEFDLLALLNDVPLLPKNRLCRMTDNPSSSGDPFMEISDHVAMEAVAKGRIVVCKDHFTSFDEAPAAFAAMYFAYQKGWLFMTADLDPGHWVYQHAFSLADNQPEVTYPKPAASSSYSLNMYGADVHLVEHYTIKLRGEMLKVTDWALVMEDLEETETHDRAIVLVPAATAGYEVVGQEDNFLDESDVYRDEWEANARSEFVNWLAIFRGEKPEVTVAKALKEEGVQHKPHCDNTAHAAFIAERKVKVVNMAELLVKFALSAEGCVSSQMSEGEARSKADTYIARMFAEQKDA